ncbi:hypothetical protein [Halorubrum halodurans]|uniref:hypothetical protein n=1 Tax=Halorubrum halodurans TaxID=1383851 RepID=UPI0015C5C562|nr:hypothetical protein [Halorubrum halodurans]
MANATGAVPSEVADLLTPYPGYNVAVDDGDTDLVDVDYFALDRFAEDPRGHGKPADNI